MLFIKDIEKWMEELAPIKLAEDWDNPGLLLGNSEAEVTKILFSLDVTDQVVEEACEKQVQMIITHHPFLFRPIKKITTQTPIGRRIIRLAQNGISVYSAHTNLDVTNGGTNDVLSNLAGLKNIRILEETYHENYKKICVTVPLLYEEKVREAMCAAGAGVIGNYSDATFTSKGTGTFRPGSGTCPYVGKENQLESVKEVKIESVVTEKIVNRVINAIIGAHPYEVPVYDIFTVEQTAETFGIGRIGELPEDETLEVFALRLKAKLGLDQMRIVGDRKKKVRRIALCTGSGVEFLDQALKKGADVYITSDLKFHEAQHALEEGLAVLDATHYATENCMMPILSEYISKKARERNFKLETIITRTDGQTFYHI